MLDIYKIWGEIKNRKKEGKSCSEKSLVEFFNKQRILKKDTRRLIKSALKLQQIMKEPNGELRLSTRKEKKEIVMEILQMIKEKERKSKKSLKTP